MGLDNKSNKMRKKLTAILRAVEPKKKKFIISNAMQKPHSTVAKRQYV